MRLNTRLIIRHRTSQTDLRMASTGASGPESEVPDRSVAKQLSRGSQLGFQRCAQVVHGLCVFRVVRRSGGERIPFADSEQQHGERRAPVVDEHFVDAHRRDFTFRVGPDRDARIRARRRDRQPDVDGGRRGRSAQRPGCSATRTLCT